jgi:hypothetical protein
MASAPFFISARIWLVREGLRYELLLAAGWWTMPIRRISSA